MPAFSVHDLAKKEMARSQHNHETYKMLYMQCTNHVRQVHQAGARAAIWVVPMFVLGRGVYDVHHAVRYIRDKLTLGKFRVEVINDTTLHIQWDDPLKKVLVSEASKKRHHQHHKPSPSRRDQQKKTDEPLSDRLERLKRSLGMSKHR